MKIEKVIKQLESILDHTRSMAASPDADNIWRKDIDALEFALTALRSVSREQVEKVWRGEWIIGEPDGLGVPIHCNRCDWGSNHADQKKWMEYQGHIFCGHCGAPMSDETVQMVMERLEALYEKD